MSYFKRSEFECGCGCGFAAVDYELLDVLNEVRGFIKTPLVITSGCRCDHHNFCVGGSEGSAHKLGLAADFRPFRSDPDKDVHLDRMYKYLLKEYPDKYGIAIKEGSFVHLDVKPGGPRRWKY